MKQHQFEQHVHCFGAEISKCTQCGALSIDGDSPFYSEEWKMVSADCRLAFKQIELFGRQKKADHND